MEEVRLWTDLELFINTKRHSMARERRAKAIARVHGHRDIFVTSRVFVERRKDKAGRTVYMRPPTPVIEEAQVRPGTSGRGTGALVPVFLNIALPFLAGSGTEHQPELLAVLL